MFSFPPLPSEYERKLSAWKAAWPVSGHRSDHVRRDCDGRLIVWGEYGRYSGYGWQIDHIVPTAAGGSDALANLRARHWQGNCAAGRLLGNAMRNASRQSR